MATRLVIASPKGGVGKTTVALNLGLAFAEKGFRTLLCDVDPQGGIGHALSKGETALPGLAELLMGELCAKEAVTATKLPTLSLLPRGRLHAADACAFEDALRSPAVLDSALREVEGAFDLVVLDTPSGMGIPTRAALGVARFLLVPLQAEPMALRSLGQALQVVEHVRAHDNPRLSLLGILPMMVERRKGPSLDVVVQVWSGLGNVLETTVPRSDVYLEASLRGLPLAYLAGLPGPEARRFELLADEVLGHMTRLGGLEAGDVERPERSLL